jgi:hypothetical protein
LSDPRFTTEPIAANNDLVSAFTKVSDTRQREFMGIPATGRPFLANNADFCRFTDDGPISEHWGSSTPLRPCTTPAPPARTRPDDPGDQGDGPDRRPSDPGTRADALEAADRANATRQPGCHPRNRPT